MDRAILWRRLDLDGHDAARLTVADAGGELRGAAVFERDGAPCRLDYRVRFDAKWRTRGARITGWMGAKTVRCDAVSDGEGAWRVNGEHEPSLRDCRDIDLSFTPATNLLAIRRLNLRRGETANATAAWLLIPEFTVTPLGQIYRRIDDRQYLYEAPVFDFRATLTVDDAGFLTHYPGLWKAVAPVDSRSETYDEQRP